MTIENKVCGANSYWSICGSLTGFSLGNQALLGVDLQWINLTSYSSSGVWQGQINASSAGLIPGVVTSFAILLDSSASALITHVTAVINYYDSFGIVYLDNVVVDFDPRALTSSGIEPLF
jgi:hypothetical protein